MALVRRAELMVCVHECAEPLLRPGRQVGAVSVSGAVDGLTSTIGFSITDEDRARLDRLAERLSGGNRSAFLRASLSVMESIERANRLRDLAVIAEEHAAERGITDENLLDAIKTSYKQR